ncbi:MAG: DinB family protein [Gemmatimonadales bacterium]|nr:DinB family protein [Gemmatimonadales bacterium]
MSDASDWTTALAEHESAVAGLAHVLAAVPEAGWWRAPAPGAWSPAAVALHVIRSYELGLNAAEGGAGMRLRVPAPAAWLSRTLLLPRILAGGPFPRRARAPEEVRPPEAEVERLGQAAAVARLRAVAAEAAREMRAAAQGGSGARVQHAYFGALPMLDGLRLLTAHTRHHTLGLGS